MVGAASRAAEEHSPARLAGPTEATEDAAVDLQLLAVALIVALAVAYVGRSAWRTWAGKKAGCASGCGKCAAPDSPEQKGRISLPQV